MVLAAFQCWCRQRRRRRRKNFVLDKHAMQSQGGKCSRHSLQIVCNNWQVLWWWRERERREWEDHSVVPQIVVVFQEEKSKKKKKERVIFREPLKESGDSSSIIPILNHQIHPPLLLTRVDPSTTRRRPANPPRTWLTDKLTGKLLSTATDKVKTRRTCPFHTFSTSSPPPVNPLPPHPLPRKSGSGCCQFCGWDFSSCWYKIYNLLCLSFQHISIILFPCFGVHHFSPHPALYISLWPEEDDDADEYLILSTLPQLDSCP